MGKVEQQNLKVKMLFPYVTYVTIAAIIAVLVAMFVDTFTFTSTFNNVCYSSYHTFLFYF